MSDEVCWKVRVNGSYFKASNKVEIISFDLVLFGLNFCKKYFNYTVLLQIEQARWRKCLMRFEFKRCYSTVRQEILKIL